jgi:hypothetical protein
MNEAVRDCLVTGYEGLIHTVDLPDPDDRHVLAAAIHADARAIIACCNSTGIRLLCFQAAKGEFTPTTLHGGGTLRDI